MRNLNIDFNKFYIFIKFFIQCKSKVKYFLNSVAVYFVLVMEVKF